PQRFGASLAHDVELWGNWLIGRAREQIGHLYPEYSGSGHLQTAFDTEGLTSERRVPIAYLWTRTVPCPNPAERPHSVPLVRQTWLVNKPRRSVALRIVPDRETMQISYEVVEAATRRELGFDPEKVARGGGASCPLCGAAVSEDYARAVGREGRYGHELM